MANECVTTPRSIDELLAVSQQLWSETSLKGLLKKFGKVLIADFGAEACGYISGKAGAGGFELERAKLKAPGVASLRKNTYDALLPALKALDLRQEEFHDGVFRISLGDGDGLWGCLACENETESHFVFWRGGDDRPSPALEFTVRQLQSESRWFRKLDSTQALIYRDDLTGLYNHRYFELTLESELRRAERFQNSFCLLFIDLDNFKSINDAHGHVSGSLCLKQVGEVIRDAVREIDVAIRYGGDEFIVVLLGATSASGLLAGERVRRSIAERPFRLESGEVTSLTASIGVAAYPEHGLNKAELLKMADETMYRSKRAGKNRVTIVSTKERPEGSNTSEGNHAGKAASR